MSEESSVNCSNNYRAIDNSLYDDIDNDNGNGNNNDKEDNINTSTIKILKERISNLEESKSNLIQTLRTMKERTESAVMLYKKHKELKAEFMETREELSKLKGEASNNIYKIDYKNSNDKNSNDLNSNDLNVKSECEYNKKCENESIEKLNNRIKELRDVNIREKEKVNKLRNELDITKSELDRKKLENGILENKLKISQLNENETKSQLSKIKHSWFKFKSLISQSMQIQNKMIIEGGKREKVEMEDNLYDNLLSYLKEDDDELKLCCSGENITDMISIKKIDDKVNLNNKKSLLTTSGKRKNQILDKEASEEEEEETVRPRLPKHQKCQEIEIPTVKEEFNINNHKKSEIISIIYEWIDNKKIKYKIEKIIKECEIPLNLIISKLIWKFKYHINTTNIIHQKYQSDEIWLYPWCLPKSRNNQLFIMTLIKVCQLENIYGKEFILLLIKELKITFYQDIIKNNDLNIIEQGCAIIAAISQLYKYLNLKQEYYILIVDILLMSSVKPMLKYLLPCLAIWPDVIDLNRNNPLLNMIIIVLMNLITNQKSEEVTCKSAIYILNLGNKQKWWLSTFNTTLEKLNNEIINKKLEIEAERIVSNIKYLTKIKINEEMMLLSELAFKLAISYFGEKWTYVMTSKQLFDWIDDVNEKNLALYLEFLLNVLSYLSVYHSDSKTADIAIFHLTMKFKHKIENLSNFNLKVNIFTSIKIIISRLSHLKINSNQHLYDLDVNEA